MRYRERERDRDRKREESLALRQTKKAAREKKISSTTKHVRDERELNRDGENVIKRTLVKELRNWMYFHGDEVQSLGLKLPRTKTGPIQISSEDYFGWIHPNNPNVILKDF